MVGASLRPEYTRAIAGLSRLAREEHLDEIWQEPSGPATRAAQGFARWGERGVHGGQVNRAKKSARKSS